MPNGVGGSDLYICRKAGNSWSKPQNIGAVVNTEGEEVFPYWSDDSTLFFSSDGQQGIGGLDNLSAGGTDQTIHFSVPENIGIPSTPLMMIFHWRCMMMAGALIFRQTDLPQKVVTIFFSIKG